MNTYESKEQAVVVCTCWELLSKWPSETLHMFMSPLEFERFGSYTLIYVSTCWSLAFSSISSIHRLNCDRIVTPENWLCGLISRFRSQHSNRVPVEDGGENWRASWCLGPKPSEEIKLKDRKQRILRNIANECQ